ncbi:MAG TPA: PilT/PilU family type 4a pilus ATPase [Candidatus Acidoferrum sp.]|nr:PilT/PilU family type 4a pilus ATPase [Candidatus Acidoferrum sp.]
MERVAPTSSLGRLLEWCAGQSATDLHAQANRRYAYRVEGKLLRIAPEQFPAPSNEDIMKLLGDAFSSSLVERIEKQHEMDLSFVCGKLRYRANFSKQQGTQSFSFRVVPQSIPKLDDLELPSSVVDLVREPRGLLLVTGAAGQGKSTTACALLQRLNETLALRVITVEDPIEYLFEEDQCQFEQREVGVDTESFATGIRNALRQDPEVIFIGEIRDRASIQAAMQAAETGHLVLATLHADSVSQAIDRIREFHSAEEQANASTLLARSLNGIICQRLIPSTLKKRIPCLEIMKRNAGIQEAIARNDLNLLSGHIEASLHEGMHSFDQYLMQLMKAGFVTPETARHYAVNWNRVEMESHGFAPTMPGILKPDPEN